MRSDFLYVICRVQEICDDSIAASQLLPCKTIIPIQTWPSKLCVRTAARRQTQRPYPFLNRKGCGTQNHLTGAAHFFATRRRREPNGVMLFAGRVKNV